MVVSGVGAAPAALLAAARAAASRNSVLGVSDPFAARLVEAVGVDFLTHLAKGDYAYYPIAGGIRGCTQRMITTIGKHTSLFDRFHRDAVLSGIRQVVILAAGLDARAWRLPWLEGTLVFEVDDPDIIALKHNTLWGLQARAIADVRIVGCDLRRDWKSALLRTEFNPDRPTAWIAEGLFRHLPANNRLLVDATSLSASGSWFAADSVPRLSTGQQQLLRESCHRLLASWKSCGLTADLDSLILLEGRSDLANELERHGWRSVSSSVTEILPAQGLVRLATNELVHTSSVVIEHVSAIRS
jgi:methyltransferase (TIGR00027 family)